ncbi:MAG TPA: nuclear transport factor 2 family protein [Solirubrobacteraceae bacterium]|jgi:ketosteroid isomerase-like protein|nr:nuclear transport factor 2 family protein [Solirubrobacteraceae bacterium]
MDIEKKRRLIDEHLAAALAGDARAAVAMYTEDVVHDVVGSPLGPLCGPQAAEGFYEELIANLQSQRLTPTHQWFGEDFAVIEHACTARVTGEFMGLPGHGREVVFRMLHVWEFRDGAISRENVWLDGGAIAAQLTAEAGPESAARGTAR